ncbi:MAG: hypothetical protein LBE18_00985 [Planctomycetaceae bacterium]|nr:hypothetical protein [Planctomycetaceae bacterium]
MTIFLFFIFQVAIDQAGFSATKTNGMIHELGRVESADGLVQVKLTVSPIKPKLSDTIILRLEVLAGTSVKIEFPDIGDSIGSLKVVTTNEENKSVSPQKELKTLVIKIIPTRSGTTPIWTMPITYYTNLSDSQNKKNIVELPMTALEIVSSISPESASLDKLVSDYKILGIDSNLWLLIIAIIILCLIGLILWLRFIKHPKKLEPELELPPHQIALKLIAELLGKKLYEADIKLFFVELSGVVRWYIEKQTSIRAPELTTEEFLIEVSQNRQLENVISKDHTARLKQFLESADMVKFAKFKPSQEEILQGVKHAQTFIVELYNSLLNTENTGEQH